MPSTLLLRGLPLASYAGRHAVRQKGRLRLVEQPGPAGLLGQCWQSVVPAHDGLAYGDVANVGT